MTTPEDATNSHDPTGPSDPFEDRVRGALRTVAATTVVREQLDPNGPTITTLAPMADLGSRSRRPRWLVAGVAGVAAATVLLAAVGFAVVRDDSGTGLDTATTVPAAPDTGGLPTFEAGYVPVGLTVQRVEGTGGRPEQQLPSTVVWTHPNTGSRPGAVDVIKIATAGPGTAFPWQLPDGPSDCTDCHNFSHAGNVPITADVNGATALVMTNPTTEMIGLSWRGESGTRFFVGATSLTFDEVLRVARAITPVTPTPEPDGTTPSPDPGGQTTLHDGWSVNYDAFPSGWTDGIHTFGVDASAMSQGSAYALAFLAADGSTVARADVVDRPSQLQAILPTGITNADHPYVIAQPTTAVAGQDGLRFRASTADPPQPGLLATGVYGGTDALSVAVDGRLPAAELIKIAQGLHQVQPAAPTTATSTPAPDDRAGGPAVGGTSTVRAPAPDAGAADVPAPTTSLLTGDLSSPPGTAPDGSRWNPGPLLLLPWSTARSGAFTTHTAITGGGVDASTPVELTRDGRRLYTAAMPRNNSVLVRFGHEATPIALTLATAPLPEGSLDPSRIVAHDGALPATQALGDGIEMIDLGDVSATGTSVISDGAGTCGRTFLLWADGTVAYLQVRDPGIDAEELVRQARRFESWDDYLAGGNVMAGG